MQAPDIFPHAAPSAHEAQRGKPADPAEPKRNACLLLLLCPRLRERLDTSAQLEEGREARGSVEARGEVEREHASLRHHRARPSHD